MPSKVVPPVEKVFVFLLNKLGVLKANVSTNVGNDSRRKIMCSSSTRSWNSGEHEFKWHTGYCKEQRLNNKLVQPPPQPRQDFEQTKQELKL
eukprot:g70339.t1